MKKILSSIIIFFCSSTPAFAHSGEGFHFEYIFGLTALAVYMVLLLLCMWLLSQILKTLRDFVEHHKSKHP